VAMTPDRVIKHLNVIEYIGTSLLSGRVDSAFDALAL
jgi:hypothetical protein